MTNPTVKSRAYRALRHLSRFTSAEVALGRFAHALRLGEGEQIVGVYHNTPNSPDVVISSLGLYLISDEATEAVAFSEIQSVTGPKEKTQADKLVIQLWGGRVVTVPILGGDASFRDVFAVQRFLDRVIADVKGRGIQ